MSIENDRRISNLYEVLKSYADTPEKLKMCQHVISKADTNDTEILQDLVSILYDGIFYGNWPWIKASFKGFK